MDVCRRRWAGLRNVGVRRRFQTFGVGREDARSDSQRSVASDFDPEIADVLANLSIVSGTLRRTRTAGAAELIDVQSDETIGDTDRNRRDAVPVYEIDALRMESHG